MLRPWGDSLQHLAHACCFFIDIECSRMAYAKKSGFHFREIKGNLFSCEKDTSLAHCISADVHMGKGIATTFKKMFGGVDELRRQGTVTNPFLYVAISAQYRLQPLIQVIFSRALVSRQPPKKTWERGCIAFWNLP